MSAGAVAKVLLAFVCLQGCAAHHKFYEGATPGKEQIATLHDPGWDHEFRVTAVDGRRTSRTNFPPWGDEWRFYESPVNGKFTLELLPGEHTVEVQTWVGDGAVRTVTIMLEAGKSYTLMSQVGEWTRVSDESHVKPDYRGNLRRYRVYQAPWRIWVEEDK